jgi:hypothetical protein
MKSYLYALFLISLAEAIAGILSPEGEKGGLLKHMRLLSALLLTVVLILPLKSGISYLLALQNGEIPLPEWEEDAESGKEDLQDRLDELSKEYFSDSLTELLETRFAIEKGQIRCLVKWEGDTPSLVTVVLSGKAIWKDPAAIEDFVSDLVGCKCQSAIEQKG